MIGTGYDVRVKIQDIVSSQLPSFILNESPLTDDFLKQFYISQEFQGGAVDFASNLDQYLDLSLMTPDVVAGEFELTAPLSDDDTVVYVNSTKSFPAEWGLLKVDNEIMTYTGITTNSFTGVVRGFSGITSYDAVNKPGDLLFQKTVASAHADGSEVENLSTLFLKEFYNKLKETFAPGFENLELNPRINVGTFISQTRSFYQTKGSVESIEILFKVLFGEDPTIIDLEKYVIKSSEAEYSRADYVTATPIEGGGNPIDLKGRTVFQSNNNTIFGAVSEIEPFTRDNKLYYKILLFVASDEISDERKLFTIPGRTKAQRGWRQGDTTLTVDTTIGFQDNHEFITADGTKFTYEERTVNQFLGVKCEDESKTIGIDDEILDDIYVSGTDSEGNLIKMRLMGVLSDVNFEGIPFSSEDERIRVDSLGENILSENATRNELSFKQIVANSLIYNTKVRFEVSSVDGSLFRIKAQYLDKSQIRQGDRIDILNRNSQEIIISDRLVDSVDFTNATVTINDSTGVPTDTAIDIRRRQRYAKSETTVIEYGNDAVLSDVLNLYDATEYDSNLYVATNSLPSYDIEASIVESKIEDIKIANFEDFNSFTNKYSTLLFDSEVQFITGDIVTYSVVGEDAEPIMSPGEYYVEVLADRRKVKFYLSPSFTGSDSFVGLTANEEPGTHLFTLESQKGRLIGARRTFRKIPLVGEKQNITVDRTPAPTGAGVIAVLTNGVEVLSYQARDKVFLGPIKDIEVASGGQGYSVTSPPTVTISKPNLQVSSTTEIPTGIATQAIVSPVVKGKLESILIDPQDFNVDNVFSITVVGGNSPGATALPKIQTKKRNIGFDARQDVFGGGINADEDTILFQTNHNLSNGQPIIYDNLDFTSVGVVKPEGGFGKLANGAKYFAEIVNARTIRLYPSQADYSSGINTVNLSPDPTSRGIQQFTTEPKKSLIGADIVEDGGDFFYRNLKFLSTNVFEEYDEIRYPNHGFSTGDLVIYNVENGAAITPLVDNTEYYVLTIDENTLKLCEVGPEEDPKFNLTRKDFINILDSGDASSVNSIRYPDVTAEVIFSTEGVVSGVITATPIVRGEIHQMYVDEGSYYGTDILNFEKNPNVDISRGQLARVKPVIINGEIISVQILSKGRNYPSDSNIVVTDPTGSGVGALLRGVFVDGELDDVVIISSGFSYDPDATTMEVVDPSKDAILIPRIRDLTVNLQARFGFESLEDNQYRIVSYDRTIREGVYKDFGGNHSPIIGWANDGNPIYGGFGLSDAEDQNSGFRALKTAYELDPNNVYGRPSLVKYPAGFFIEDYTYTDNGDLDEYNGRYCRTPEFPNGTYAYFAGISTDTESVAKAPQFPYFIGPEYRDAPFDQSTANVSQDFNVNDKPIYRNTFPYAVGQPFVGSEFLTQSYLEDTQEAIITAINQGSVNGIEVVGAGVSYKVGDIPVFDPSQDFLSCQVTNIVGKEVSEINTQTLSYDRLSTRIIRTSDTSIRVYVDPSHDYLEKDSVIFSGLSTELTSLSGPQIIKLDQRVMSLYSPLQPTLSGNLGQIDDIFVNSITDNVSVGSSITIGIGSTGSEVAEIINVFPVNKAFRVKRLTGFGVTHPIGDLVTPFNSFFDVQTESPEFISKLDEVYYFNPTQTLGYGEEGTQIELTYSIGNIDRKVSVAAGSLYAPLHGFTKLEAATLTAPTDNDPLLGIDPVSGVTYTLPRFGDTEVDVYVVSLNSNTVGLRTTSDGPNLLFAQSGIDSPLYSLRSKRPYEDVSLDRIQANVTVATPHELTSNDIVTMQVINTGTTGIGSNPAVVVEFDEITQSTIIDPQFAEPSGIDTDINFITINDHGFIKGDYVLYETLGSPIGGLSDHEKYFVVPFDTNRFQLAETFKDIQPGSELIVNLTSVGIGSQKFSKVNPKLNITSDSNIRFDISSPTLLDMELDFYYDQALTEVFENNGIDKQFVVSGVSTAGFIDGEKVIQFSENNPTTLYYGLSKGGYISTSDTNANQYNAIEYIDSIYSREAIITVVDDNKFVYSLTKQPEEILYTDKTAKLSYLTSSKSATGGVGKVRIINTGRAFADLPEFITIESASGTNATLKATSDDIGTISAYRIQNPGWGYSADKTLRPNGKVQPKLEYDDSDFVTDIIVTQQANGYQTEPQAVVVDFITRETVDNGSLIVEVQSSVVTGVEIEVAPSGLSKNKHEVYTVNNTNGIPILQITRPPGTVGIISAIIQTPIAGYDIPPFSIGDRVFVENVIGVGVNSVTNMNSPEIGYRFGEVISIVGGSEVGVVIQYPDDVVIGAAQTFQGAFSSLVNEKNYPKFEVLQQTAILIVGERLSVFDGQGGILETDLIVEESNTNFFKISGNYDILPGDRLKGNISGVIVTVTRISNQNCSFTIDPTSRVDAGWLDNIGFLNDEFQNTPDNDYYQNLSYSIKSKVNYVDLAGPVNRIVHPAGLKNFSDTKIESSGRLGVDAGDSDSTIILDFVGLTDVADTPLRVDRINVFDLGYDAEIQDNKSNAIRFNSKVPNKRLTPFTEVKTNRVLLHDDISSQFIDADNSQRKDPYVDFSIITDTYTRAMLHVRNPFTDEVQLTEIISLTKNNNASTMQKATVFDGETPKGVFESVALNSSDYIFRWTPADDEAFDADLKLFTNKFEGNSDGPIDIGYATLSGSSLSVDGGVERRIYLADDADHTGVVCQLSVTRSNGPISYLEIYAFTDGTTEYNAVYGFDNTSGINFSDTFGEVRCIRQNGKLAVFIRNTDPDICLIDCKFTVFKPTDTGINPYRFKRTTIPDGSERGLNLMSSAVTASSSDTSIDVVVLDADLFQACRTVVYIDGTDLGAIHQVMAANSDGDTITNTYPFITEGNGVGGSGIGTFGSVIDGDDWIIRFYPDATQTETLTFTAYTEAFYRDYDSINYVSTPLSYEKNEERYYIQQYIAPQGQRNNKTRFELTYEGTPIYEKTFTPELDLGNLSTTPPDRDVFLISDHFFSNAEELYYEPGDSIEGNPFSPLQISPVTIGSTTYTTMPPTVFAIKNDLNRFQLAATKQQALDREFITITGFGQGNAHRIGMKKKLAKTVITVNGVLQTPLSPALLSYELSEPVGAANSFLTLTGIGTVKVGDLMYIDQKEYVTIDNVGFGTSPDGPINNIGTFPLIEVQRGTMGTIATSHTASTRMELYKGTFNIVASDIVFVEAPTGRGDQEINQSNLVELNASFQGRTFLQQSYDEIVVYDNIANQFDGTRNSFKLTALGSTFTEIENGNGSVLINDIYQTPSTDNNPGNNYFFDYNALNGETTIVFTGIEDDLGQRVESEFDINQNQIPRGGLIVSVGSTPGLGYAPLYNAIIGAGVSGGAITGILTTDQIGVTTSITYAVYNKDNGDLDLTILGAPAGPVGVITDALYFNESGRVIIDSSTPHDLLKGDVVNVTGMGFSCSSLTTTNVTSATYDEVGGVLTVTTDQPHGVSLDTNVQLSGLGFTCVNSGITTNIFPDSPNDGFSANRLNDFTFVAFVGVSTIVHTYTLGGTVTVGLTTNIYPDKNQAYVVESIISPTRFALEVGVSDIPHTYTGGGTYQKYDQFLFGSDLDNPSFVYLQGLEFTCPGGSGITTTFFPDQSNKVPVYEVIDAAHIKVNVGTSTITHTYVGGGTIGQYSSYNVGSGYNSEVPVLVVEEGHTGAAASIIGIPGPGGELYFNIIDGGSGYVNPYVSVPSPTYFNLPTKTVFRRNVVGVPTEGNQGKNLFITCDVGSSKTTAIGRSEYFNVNNFDLTNQGYGFELGDVIEVIGLATDKSLSQPIEPFQITIESIFDDNFGAWSYGEVDYLDSIAPFQDGRRLRFPIIYRGKPLSFEQDITNEDSAAIDMASLLMIYVDTVLQVPNVDYFFEGGTSFQFSSAPLPQEKIDVYFYTGKDGVDSLIVQDISESIKPGDQLQMKKNDANNDDVGTQDIRTVTELASSDTARTNLYVGNRDLDAVKPRQVAWDKQKRDIFIYGLPVYKTRDILEPVIKPQARLIRNASQTTGEMFMSTADLFLYEEEIGDKVIVETNVRVIKSLSESFEPAGFNANVNQFGRVTSVDVIDGGRGYPFPNVPISLSSPYELDGTQATCRGNVDFTTGEITSVSILNPGIGYTTSIPVLAIAADQTVEYEDITNIPNVTGYAGIITGMEYRNSSEPGSGGYNTMTFYYKVVDENPINLGTLQPGYPVVISDTVAGPGGVVPVGSSPADEISQGGDFCDAIYEVLSNTFLTFSGFIVCRIQSSFNVPELPSGVILRGQNLGQFSWGRLGGMNRNPDAGSLEYTNIEDQQFTADMRNYPKITRTSNGLRDQGGLDKFLIDDD